MSHELSRFGYIDDSFVSHPELIMHGSSEDEEIQPSINRQIDEKTRVVINDSVEAAYAWASDSFREDPSEIHAIGLCHDISARVVLEMGLNGYDTRIDNRGDHGGHSYVVLMVSGGELVIDPTWQQFVRKEHRQNAPRILLGSRDEVLTIANDFISYKDFLRLWRSR